MKGYKKTTEQFIKEAITKHGNKYNYDDVIYEHTDKKVNISCPIHGKILQTPRNHLRTAGCKRCGIEKGAATAIRIKKSSDQYFKEVIEKHNNKYDYSKSIYIDTTKYMIIGCYDHGDFLMTAANHLSGHGCSKCAIQKNTKNRTYTNEEIDQYLIDNNFTILRFNNYKKALQKIDWFCWNCNIISNICFNNLKYNGGCSLCKTNKENEKLVEKFLKISNIEFEKIIIMNIDKKYLPDFYLPEYNLIIEYNGEHHYFPVKYGGMSEEKAKKAFEKQIKRDEYVRQYCKDNNIELLEIDGREYKKNKLIDFLDDYFANLIYKEA